MKKIIKIYNLNMNTDIMDILRICLKYFYKNSQFNINNILVRLIHIRMREIKTNILYKIEINNNNNNKLVKQ